MTDTQLVAATRDGAYRRLLRWYPRTWRARHGEALLGILLDGAEAEGRLRPTSAEHWTVAVDGMGHHLDRRVALGCAIGAVATGLLAVVLWMIGGFADGVLAAIATLIFVLQSTAAIAVARAGGLVGAPAAVAALAAAVPAAILTALAGLSWSVGFDEADAGRTPSALAAAWPALVLLAWVLGALAWSIVLRDALSTAGVRRPWHTVLGAISGAIIMPLLAVGQLSPVTGLLISLGVLVSAVLLTTTIPPVVEPPVVEPVSIRRPGHSPSAHRSVAALALGSALLGVGAIAFALAGSNWSSLDATEAMRVGIGGGLLAAVPLALTVGIVRTRPGRSGISAWGPALLLALSLAVAGAANVFGATSDGNVAAALLWASSVPAGVAVTWMIVSASWQTRAARAAVGAAAGLAVIVQGLLLQSAPFVLPIVALVIAIVGVRRARRDDGSRLRQAVPD